MTRKRNNVARDGRFDGVSSSHARISFVPDKPAVRDPSACVTPPGQSERETEIAEKRETEKESSRWIDRIALRWRCWRNHTYCRYWLLSRQRGTPSEGTGHPLVDNHFRSKGYHFLSDRWSSVNPKEIRTGGIEMKYALSNRCQY